MQTREYIILEAKNLGAPSKSKGALVRLGSARKSVASTVHIDEITDSKARQLNRDGKTIAPVFPMSLIRPMNASGALGSLTATPWGLDAVGAISSPYSGEGAVVALLDTGIDAAHPAFAHMTGRIEQKNFANDGKSGDAMDDHGHGTHCAGTIFGGSVNGIPIGIAPNIARALIGRVFNKGGDCDTRHLLNAINWAVEEHANIISMSIGIDFVGYQARLVRDGMPQDIATSYALEGYLQNVRLFSAVANLQRERAILLGKMICIVAASGNDSRRDDDKSYTIAVGPPAAGDGVISVGALCRDANGYAVSSFSNAGVTVSAPGSGILSACLGSGFQELDGTSMATPHVAGVAALWFERWSKTNQLVAQTFSSNVMAQTRPVDGDPSDVGSGIIFSPQ